MRYAKLVLAIVMLSVVLIFVLENSSPVTLKFLFWKTPAVSLAVVAAGFFVLGILFSVVIHFLLRMKKSKAVRHKGAQSHEVRPAPGSQNESTSLKDR